MAKIQNHIIKEKWRRQSCFCFCFWGLVLIGMHPWWKGTSNIFSDSAIPQSLNLPTQTTDELNDCCFFSSPHMLGWTVINWVCQKTFAVFNIWSGWSLEFASKAISWGTLCHAEIPKLWHNNMHHIVYAHRSTIYHSYTIIPPHWTHFWAIHFGAR